MDEMKSEQKQYLVFKIENEEYGVDIRKVNTIIEKGMPIARVPKTPNYIKGVINLRGEIIPIMDLRLRFDLPEIEATETTRIIILNIDETTIGLIVDSVAEVVKLNEETTESISDFSSILSKKYISGVGKLNKRIIIIIDLIELI